MICALIHETLLPIVSRDEGLRALTIATTASPAWITVEWEHSHCLRLFHRFGFFRWYSTDNRE